MNCGVSELVLRAQSTTKDYIRAKHKLHSISKLFISQVIITQFMFFFNLFIFRGHSTREPASGRVTHFFSAGLHRNHVLAITSTGKIGRSFGKNAGEWTGRVEISKHHRKS